MDELHPTRDLSRSPLFQVVFGLQTVALREVRIPGLTLEPVAVDTGAVKFELVLAMTDDGRSLRGELKYRTELFDATTAERLLGHFQALLEAVVADPNRRLSDLPLLSEAERRQVVEEWTGGRAAFPVEACLHQLFEEQARRTPDAVAVTFGGENLTYGELNCRANRVAHRLRALGIGPDNLVGVCLERSANLVVGLLAVLKAGGAYLPLDPAYPAERLAFVLGDAKSASCLPSNPCANGYRPTPSLPSCSSTRKPGTAGGKPGLCRGSAASGLRHLHLGHRPASPKAC